MLFYNAYNQFAYPFFADLSGDKTLAYPLFNYGYFYKEMNYDQIRTLTLKEQSEISYRVDKAVELFNEYSPQQATGYLPKAMLFLLLKFQI